MLGLYKTDGETGDFLPGPGAKLKSSFKFSSVRLPAGDAGSQLAAVPARKAGTSNSEDTLQSYKV